MKILSLDIGQKRTGVAFVDEEATGIVMPLETLRHDSGDEFLAAAKKIILDRKAEHIVIGLPLLPSGEEGSQAAFVRGRAERLRDFGVPFTFVDERYTSRTLSPALPQQKSEMSVNPDEMAAIAILEAYIRS